MVLAAEGNSGEGEEERRNDPSTHTLERQRMSDPANAIQIDVNRCHSDEDFHQLRTRYISEWGPDHADHPLRSVLEDAIERRQLMLQRMRSTDGEG